jgi:hypothetical protein
MFKGRYYWVFRGNWMNMMCLPIPETTPKVAVFNRNGWQLCAGTGGNFQPEWVAVLLRNMQVETDFTE